MVTNESFAFPAIELADGFAEPMGDGVFVVLQKDEGAVGAPMQNVVLSLWDLETLKAHDTSIDTIALEDGQAHWMGDYFLIEQADRSVQGHPVQAIALTFDDAEALRLAA
ncbi:hypothetical protein PX554_13905 [Sphingomonas sp. H39-1-10]|uniref:hypothetical protein n=1 Tax=Sphingomonas pollutisoli TaxID=3030829 RepID=UPI0023B99A12|nr:hypothetical protein [Sphingomonas pollutisoli]MDF0489231.1 hypothetical protein [Sphingomonas pollutisoli]